MASRKSTTRSSSAPRSLELTLPPGLSRVDALKLAVKKMPRGTDARGFTYDRRTGKATLT